MQKVLVFAHDAGGGEIIAAYVRKHSREKAFVCYAAGPAANIFRRARIPLHVISDSPASIVEAVRTHSNAEYALIAAPGWMTKIEVRALREAKRRGMRTVVYLDSWTMYRERFGWPRAGWRKSLPDSFWAGDRYALALAKKLFSVPVRLVPSGHDADMRRRYRAEPHAASSILFLSAAGIAGRDAFEMLLRSLNVKKDHLPLLIRFHPADSRSRYDELLREHPRIIAGKSSEKDLVRDLARARVVVGAETAALASAALVGKRTICILPRGKKSYLPQRAIRRVHSVEALGKALSA